MLQPRRKWCCQMHGVAVRILFPLLDLITDCSEMHKITTRSIEIEQGKGTITN